MKAELGGVWAPIATPLDETGAIDASALAGHAHVLVDEGCRGVLLFGTTGEAPSFTVDERRAALDALVEHGFPPGRLLVGSGSCAGGDSLALSSHASGLGVAGLLVLPPFYFKGVSEEGLYRSFATLVEQCEGSAPFLLYHFPRLSGVPIALSLARRLADEFPERVVGVKDSSGDLESTRAFLGVSSSFAVFPGTESVLPALRHDAIAGCISAGANVHAGLLARAWRTLKEGGGEVEERVLRLRAVLDRYPMIPALKALLAHRGGGASWTRVRPPLVALPPEDRARLVVDYEGAVTP